MYYDLLRFYRHIGRCERLDPGELARTNFLRLKKLAVYAFEHVDYYRELYESEHFDPRTLRGTEDLCRLPAVEKEHFRSFPKEKRISSDFKNKKIIELSTSGSTGQPLRFYTDGLELSKQTLKWLYVLRKHGYKPTDNLIQIYRPLANSNTSFVQKIGLFRRRIISIFDPMDAIVDNLAHAKVSVLAGIKSSLVIVGEELHKRKIEIRPKFLVSTGEVLTENDRQLLRKYYNANTIDIYATSETGNIAYSCPKCKYLHIHCDSIYINSCNSGETLHLTNLENLVTPFINYNLADKIVYLGEYTCRCGSKYPMIRTVLGREGDYIISSTGRKYNSQFFTARLKFIDFLDQYKIIQRKDRAIVIALKLGRSIDGADKRSLRDAVLRKFPVLVQNNDVRVDFVDGFSIGKHGKIRVIENEYIENDERSKN